MTGGIGETMEEQVRGEIRRFVLESELNRFPSSEARYFDEPLVGIAAADDPLFTEYKRIIGPFHLTPREIMADDGESSLPASVICWVLPIATRTLESNRREVLRPSREWAQTRSFGEQFNAALRRHMVSWLNEQGYRAVAPQLSPLWRELTDPHAGIASSWSERHAAYAAGLGTFSLNDALITPRGIAHRLGSIVTDLYLRPDKRPYPERRHNCLYYREGTCGICICRCPAGALSRQGHDKLKCRTYVYEELPRTVGELYGVPQTGCGLCQTKVPCSERIPPGSPRFNGMKGGGK